VFEASQALMSWAMHTTDVPAFVPSVGPHNEAPRGVARKLGFRKVGSWVHDVRGTEHVHRLERRRGRSSRDA